MSVIYSNETQKVFEFTIENNNTFSLDNVTWSINFGDGDILNGDSSVSLDANESLQLYALHNYDIQAEYAVTVNALALPENLSAESELTIGLTNLSVLLTEIYFNSTEKIFSLDIQSNDSDPKDINWTLNLGDGTVISSEHNVTLEEYEDIFVYLAHQYSNPGEYFVTASVFNGLIIASSTMYTDTGALAFKNLSTINQNGLKNTFEFVANNSRFTTVSNLLWTFDAGSGYQYNGSFFTNLTPGEDLYVFVEHTYGSTGNYVVNASISNESLSDYEILEVTI